MHPERRLREFEFLWNRIAHLLQLLFTVLLNFFGFFFDIFCVKVVFRIFLTAPNMSQVE